MDNGIQFDLVNAYWCATFKEQNHIMADLEPHEEHILDLEIDPDFEPQKRPRSCTWPLPRPESDVGKAGTTDTDILQEEEDGENETEGICQNASSSTTDSKCTIPTTTTTTTTTTTNHTAEDNVLSKEGSDGSPTSTQAPTTSLSGIASQQPRKTSARRNAWGNYSYADLITQAIESSPESRLTLSQIYDWMIRCVPYFKDKGDSNSSAGWKNSIRHNLSLHSRFVKVQNEGTGKSSWWMVNSEGGKGGKVPRRRAVSMDNGNKYIKGARGRATKKKAALQASQDGSSESSSSLSKWTGSPTSRSSDELDAWTDFRSRTNSNASTVNLELDEMRNDDSPLSPMLYSSSSSMSPSTGPAGLSDLAGTINLNDGLPDDLMDDLLDNISLTASQLPPGEEETGGTGANGQGGSVFTFSFSGSSLGVPSSSYGPNSLFSTPSVAGLRQAPMQTIQENKQAIFPCVSRLDHTLQDLLSLETHSHNDVMLTQSDPLMSQASAAVTLQNSRRNGILLRKDPMMAKPLDAECQAQSCSVAGWRAGMPTAAKGPSNSKRQQLKSPSKIVSMQLGSSTAAAQHRFSPDLDMDVFNGGLECDMDTIIRNELMDADCLDLSFDSDLNSAQNTNINGGDISSSEPTSS